MFFGVPLDIILFVVVYAAVFTWLFYFGKSAGVSLFIATLTAFFLQTISPLTELLSTKMHIATPNVPLLSIACFVGFTLLLFFVFKRVISTVFSWSPFMRIFEGLALTLMLLGLFLLSLQELSKGSLPMLHSPNLKLFLEIPHIFFYWISGSLVVLFLTSKRP